MAIGSAEEVFGDAPRPGAETAPRGAAWLRGVQTSLEQTSLEQPVPPPSEAVAAVRSLRKALLAQLPAALRRAEAAEVENERLRLLVEELRKLHEGLLAEIKMRDAEIAGLRAAASVRRPGEHARASVSAVPAEVVEASPGAPPILVQADVVEVVTISAAGPLGLTFDADKECLKLVEEVEELSPAWGKLFPSDEVISVGGEPARNLTWVEFYQALQARPLVMSVRRDEQELESRRNDGGERRGTLRGAMRSFSGWTRAAVGVAGEKAKAAAQEVKDALNNLDSLPLDHSGVHARTSRSGSEVVAGFDAETLSERRGEGILP